MIQNIPSFGFNFTEAEINAYTNIFGSSPSEWINKINFRETASNINKEENLGDVPKLGIEPSFLYSIHDMQVDI